MTTAATSLLGLALPVTGELQGTWGTTVNDSITSLLDTAVAGTTTLSTDGDVTLTTTTLASNQARQAILLCSGARTALRTITAPAQSKIYTIINATTGGYAVKLVGVGPTTGLTIPNGASAVVAWNGSDFIEIGSSTIGNLTVNGNLTVTGTSTLTGAATLTANPTLSAGTANGVAYLNGSKVVTTGSALVFDGTNLGIGTSSPTGKLQVKGTVNFEATNSTNVWNLYTFTDNTLRWNYNGAGADELVLDSSGNLGLGVTPSAWASSRALQIGSSLAPYMGLAQMTTGTADGYMLWGAYLTGNRTFAYTTTGDAPAAYRQNAGAHAWLTAPSGTAGNAITFTQAMTLDASGNLLVGNTSGFSVGETNTVQAKGPFVLAANNTGSASNRNWLMIANSSGAGNLDFVDSATNTGWPNNAYRMTLTSSGNLGLGVTPSAWNSNFRALQTGSGYASFVGDGSNGYAEVLNNCYASGASTYTYFASLAATRYSQQLGVHKWYTAGSGTAGNAITFTQAMTLDANGRLFVGTTSGATKLDVRGTSNTVESTIQIVGNTVSSLLLGQNADGGVIRGQGGNNALTFWTGGSGDTGAGQSGTERARIDSSGNLLVGTTSGTNVARVLSAGVADSYPAFRAETGATTSQQQIAFVNPNGLVGSITTNGSATAYNTSSDYRLKDNQKPLTGSGAFIDALQPKTWEWKADGSKGVGFIAHEVQEVSPGSVVGEKDAVDKDGKPKYQAMEYGSAEFIANIIAELQSLRKRVAALEAK